MKKLMITFRVFALLALLVFVHTSVKSETVGVFFDSSVEQIKFAAGDVKTALESKGHTVEMHELATLSTSYTNKRIVISLASNTSATSILTSQGGAIPTGLKEQAYALRTTTNPQLTFWAFGGDVNGAMYGGLQIAENIGFFDLTGTYNNEETPKILKRGIKLNLSLDAVSPTYEYVTKGSSTKNSIEHTWDINFWKSWFDEMARNRYNYLSIWTNHPFTSMLKLDEYPNVYIQNVTGFNGFTKVMTLVEKIAFWRQVMTLAHARGFEFMMFNWNVWLNNAAGQYGLTNDAVTTANQTYVYKSMVKLLELYPELDGFGVTNGEKTSTVDFLWEAYGKAMYESAVQNPQRKYRFIVRWYMASPSEVKSKFAQLLTLPNVTLEFSYKYSKAHMYSMAVPAYMDEKLNDLSSVNMKTWLTLRNDDFYYNQWGDPSYARAYLKGIYDRSYVSGFYMGSDGYNPTKTFFSKNSVSQGKLEVQRQWYMNMIWGRLAYNPLTSDDVFKNYMKSKFPSIPSADLFTAWSKASSGVQLFNELIHLDFDVDYKWYPEICQSGQGGFVTINQLATASPGPGSNLCSMSLSAANNFGGKKPSLQLATEMELNALQALELVNTMPLVDPNTEVGVTINSVKTLAYLSMYYVYKIRATTYLNANLTANKTEALGQAYCWWMKYSALMDKMYYGQENQRTRTITNWRMYDATVLKEYTDNGGVGTPSCAVSQQNIVVSANNTNEGSVAGGGQFNSGTTATVTATSKAGFRFSEWKESGTRVSTDSIYSFTVTDDRFLEAFFKDKSSCDVPWSTADLVISNTTITNQSLGVVNTSCAPNVIISADLEGLGGLDPTDYCQLSYKIDGGSTSILFDIINLRGAFAKQSFSKSVTANSVELVLNSKNTANDEIYKISNIKIVSAPTAIENVKFKNPNKAGIHIFPNPTSNELNIEFANTHASRDIKIFNLVGQIIYQLNTSEKDVKIKTQTLNYKGFVTIQVMADNKIDIQKILIK